MDASTLKHIVKSVLEGYSGESLNGYSYLTQDPDENVFTSVSVGQSMGVKSHLSICSFASSVNMS
jgi:hypothetical protein